MHYQYSATEWESDILTGRNKSLGNCKFFNTSPRITAFCIIIRYNLCAWNICRIIFSLCKGSNVLEEDVVDVQPGSELISGFRKSLLGMKETYCI